MDKTREGWTWLFNARKWHYFTDEQNHSLCGKYMLLSLGELKQGNNDSPDNCKACLKKLRKRNESSKVD